MSGPFALHETRCKDCDSLIDPCITLTHISGRCQHCELEHFVFRLGLIEGKIEQVHQKGSKVGYEFLARVKYALDHLDSVTSALFVEVNKIYLDESLKRGLSMLEEGLSNMRSNTSSSPTDTTSPEPQDPTATTT